MKWSLYLTKLRDQDLETKYVMSLVGKFVTNILLNEHNNETTPNDIAIPIDHHQGSFFL